MVGRARQSFLQYGLVLIHSVEHVLILKQIPDLQEVNTYLIWGGITSMDIS